MEGHLNVWQLDKIKEKDGPKEKGYKKLKFGKFTLQKTYKTKILEDLVEDLRQERKNEKIDKKMTEMILP